ncbi:MAG: PAS domain-containing protein, partial [Chloroflexales bacterium]|nr:PAS domain-containing protein [Chloroflexales bacterium]
MHLWPWLRALRVCTSQPRERHVHYRLRAQSARQQQHKGVIMEDGTPPSAGDFPESVDSGDSLAPQTPLGHLIHMLALTDDAILGADPQFRVTIFNRAAAQLFGYAAPEVLGQPLGLLLPALATLDPADATPNLADQTLAGVRKDGTSIA